MYYFNLILQPHGIRPDKSELISSCRFMFVTIKLFFETSVDSGQ